MTKEERESLHQRMKEQSTEDLLRIVNIDADDYREEALELAREELKRRGVSALLEKTKLESVEELSEAVAAEVEKTRELTCKDCGGPIRYASLLGEREIILTFHDNYDRRFLEILVCPKCGKIAFKVDFETEVRE